MTGSSPCVRGAELTDAAALGRVQRLVVCIDRQDDPVGFAVVGLVRDGGVTGAPLGELYAINLDPDAWG